MLSLQYQPVLGSTLKGKDNFKKLIHGFAEVRFAASASSALLLLATPSLRSVVKLLMLLCVYVSRVLIAE